MPRRIDVVGHKHPGTDSIVSALAYAELVRLQGVRDFAAACRGAISEAGLEQEISKVINEQLASPHSIMMAV